MEPVPARDEAPQGVRKKPIRRWLFGLALLAGLYAALEIGSVLAFRHLDGKSFHYSRLQRERKKICEEWARLANTTPFEGYYAIHPYLGMVYNPRFPVPLPGEDRVTEFGFPDKGPPVRKKAPGKVIVGILGGSVASMFSCQGTQSLAHELIRSPRFAGKRIEFVNLAVGGFKQPQQVMALNYALAMGGEFDVILNLDGFNEVALYPPENQPQGIFSLFPRGWHRLAASSADPAIHRINGEINYLARQRERWARRFMGRAARYSVTLNLIWRAHDRKLAADANRCALALQGHRPRTEVPYCSIGPGKPFPNDQEMFGELVDTWKRCSLQLDRICKGYGMTYYHFLQPNQYVPGSKEMGPEERQAAWQDNPSPRVYVEKAYPLLRAAGKEIALAGVHYRDLSMIFAAHKEPIYVDNCCHINRAGNDLLAAAIAQALLETREPPAEPREHLRPTPAPKGGKPGR